MTVSCRSRDVRVQKNMKSTVWERGFNWPKSGPLTWLSIYLVVISVAGVLFWMGLGFFSPTTPDEASGHIYQVPGGRHSPDFYVERGNAFVLRFAAGHAALLITVGGLIGLSRAGAKKPQGSDEI
jgi:hypothetical protein